MPLTLVPPTTVGTAVAVGVVGPGVTVTGWGVPLGLGVAGGVAVAVTYVNIGPVLVALDAGSPAPPQAGAGIGPWLTRMGTLPAACAGIVTVRLPSLTTATAVPDAGAPNGSNTTVVVAAT